MALWRHSHAAKHTSTGIVNVEKHVYAITVRMPATPSVSSKKDTFGGTENKPDEQMRLKINAIEV